MSATLPWNTTELRMFKQTKWIMKELRKTKKERNWVVWVGKGEVWEKLGEEEWIWSKHIVWNS